MILKTSTLLGLSLVVVAIASIQTVPLLPETPLVNNNSSNQTGTSQNQTFPVQDLLKVETPKTVEPSNLTTPTLKLGFTVSSISTAPTTPTSVTVTAKSVNGSIDPKEFPTETVTTFGSNFSSTTASPIVTTPTVTNPTATEATSPFTVATPTTNKTTSPSPNSVASLLSSVTLFGGSGALSQKEALKSDALNSTSEIASTTTTTLAPPPSSTSPDPLIKPAQNQQHRNVLVVNLENPFDGKPHHVRGYGGPFAFGSDSEVDFEDVDDDDDAYDPVELSRELESAKVQLMVNRKKE